jgi:hypothetical protein
MFLALVEFVLLYFFWLGVVPMALFWGGAFIYFKSCDVIEFFTGKKS